MFCRETSDGSTIGFASQLRLLVNALDSSLGAQFMEDFVSGLKNLYAVVSYVEGGIDLCLTSEFTYVLHISFCTLLDNVEDIQLISFFTF